MRHAPSHPVPPEAALDPDPALWLAWAPLQTGYGGCGFDEACESDEACTCRETLRWMGRECQEC